MIAPIGMGVGGETLNINADTAAGAIAASIGAKRLLMLTDIEGVLNKQGKLIPEMTASQARLYIADGTIRGGMILKIETRLEAVAAASKAPSSTAACTPAARAVHRIWSGDPGESRLTPATIDNRASSISAIIVTSLVKAATYGSHAEQEPAAATLPATAPIRRCAKRGVAVRPRQHPVSRRDGPVRPDRYQDARVYRWSSSASTSMPPMPCRSNTFRSTARRCAV